MVILHKIRKEGCETMKMLGLCWDSNGEIAEWCTAAGIKKALMVVIKGGVQLAHAVQVRATKLMEEVPESEKWGRGVPNEEVKEKGMKGKSRRGNSRKKTPMPGSFSAYGNEQRPTEQEQRVQQGLFKLWLADPTARYRPAGEIAREIDNNVKSDFLADLASCTGYTRIGIMRWANNPVTYVKMQCKVEDLYSRLYLMFAGEIPVQPVEPEEVDTGLIGFMEELDDDLSPPTKREIVERLNQLEEMQNRPRGQGGVVAGDRHEPPARHAHLGVKEPNDVEGRGTKRPRHPQEEIDLIQEEWQRVSVQQKNCKKEIADADKLRDENLKRRRRMAAEYRNDSTQDQFAEHYAETEAELVDEYRSLSRRRDHEVEDLLDLNEMEVSLCERSQEIQDHLDHVDALDVWFPDRHAPPSKKEMNGVKKPNDSNGRSCDPSQPGGDAHRFRIIREGLSAQEIEALLKVFRDEQEANVIERAEVLERIKDAKQDIWYTNTAIQQRESGLTLNLYGDPVYIRESLQKMYDNRDEWTQVVDDYCWSLEQLLIRKESLHDLIQRLEEDLRTCDPRRPGGWASRFRCWIPVIMLAQMVQQERDVLKKEKKGKGKDGKGRA